MKPSEALTKVALVAVLAATAGCQRGELKLPTAEEVEARYLYEGRFEARLRGNVVELRAGQPADHLRRGGALWAKVGPYILLFSEETRRLFQDYPGVAAVRAVTLAPGGSEIARATLLRDELNEMTWWEALALAGHARVEGTQRPTRLEALVRWGEDHTSFRYNRRWVPE